MHTSLYHEKSGESGRWMWYWNHFLLEMVPEVQEICMYSFSKIHSLSYWWKKMGWGHSRIGCWERYLDIRGIKQREWRRLNNERLLTCTTHQILFVDHFKNEIGWACDIYPGEERCIQGFGGETWRNMTIWKTS